MKPLAQTDMQVLEQSLDPKNQEAADQGKIETALKALVDDFDLDGAEERLWQLAEIQRCLMLWHGEPGLYWNETARSWQNVWDAHEAGLVDDDDVESFDRDINFYRPLLESVIAAASIEIPRIHFVPARASEPLDILTAREATKVSTYLDIVNDARKKLHDAYFILANQHFVAGFLYRDEDGKKYGFDDVAKKGMVQKSRQVEYCPQCLGDTSEAEPSIQGDPYGEAEINPQFAPPEMHHPTEKMCPNCNMSVEPQPDEEHYEEEDVIGYDQVPRSKICIEVYGPQNVKVPFWTKDLASTPYLELYDECAVGYLAQLYPEKAEEILKGASQEDTKYDRWVRDPIIARGYSSSRSTRSTHRRIWVRDWGFNYIGDKDIRETIKQQYPDGACIIFVGEVYIKTIAAKMDEQWDLSETSFSETIHDDPGGKIVIPTCEIQNDMIQLWVENIKHNIPQTFVDAQLFDLKEFGKVPARPGLMTPVKRLPGQNISAGIHETRPVTISQESSGLYQIAEQVSQFTSGAMPSIFGGTLRSSNRNTAYEYDASRQAALQRVALRLSTVNSWWARLKLKAVQMYKASAQRVQEFSAKSGDGYKSVVIDPENLQGLIDHALPEDSAMFPTTWSQKRDFAIQALQSGEQHLIQVLFHPENSTILKEFIGIPELFIPGEQDRMKQLWEISELMKQAPVEMPEMGPAGPQMVPHSTIPPNPNTDNSMAHIMTLQGWLNSEEGREAEKNNPDGYNNVMAHLMEHLQLMQSVPPGGAGAPPPGEPGAPPPPNGEPGPVAPPPPGPIGPPQGGA